MSKHASIPPSWKRSAPVYLQSLTVPFLLGLVCFLVYNANLRQIGTGDTFPARFLPLILWHEGTLALDANARLVANGHSMIANRNRPAGADGKVAYFEPRAYWMIRTRHHQLASLYPVVTPILVAPFYVPAVIWLNEHGWAQPQIGRVAELMEKISASLLASITSVLMYLLLRRDGSRWSLPLAMVFAFGTNTWMISSQALWQHGTGELLIALALLLVVSPASPVRTSLLGAVCVLMAANRPPDALVAGAIVLFAVWSRRRSALWLLAGATVPLAAILVFNLHYIGSIAGGYALGKNPNKPFFQLDWSGVPGLLVSPARGLLVFSPFLVFVPVGLIQRLRSPDSKGLAVALGVAVAAQVLLYSQADWRAGVSWGPRWLTDLLPVLMWMLAPAPLVLRPFARGLFILAMAMSVVVQTIGAFWYTKASDELVYAGNPASMSGAWDLSNVPFLTELRHPPPRGELLYDARGSLDRVGPTLLQGIEEVPKLESGAVLEGWALTGGRSPAQLVVLIDGVVIGSTEEFLPRADVNEATHTTSPSAWRVFADTRGVPPGERVLQLAVRIEPRSDIRIIREQRVFVVPQEPRGEAAPPPAAPGKPLDDAHGSLDRVGPTLLQGIEEVPKLESGAVLEGWALTRGRSPAQLVVLIDGVVIGSTEEFLPRADVNEATHTTSPSAWRVFADTRGVPPGERVLQLAVRIEPRSDIRIIREQRVFVVPQEPRGEAAPPPRKLASGPELEAMAKRAAQLLRERQAESGYWLTSHTRGRDYEASQQEMNTFITSMLVDLLSPVARQQGLDNVVEQARQHLAAQIESNGLVRYHGLPDGPTIGKLGCAITPDADDTALVWRIARPSAGDPRQQLMLAELARYRDARGLYRTWLAPQAQYKCIDPGSDPNPTDIAIQMHVYLMLRDFDPSAAQDLCRALQRSFWDEDIWTYYARTSLVPYLRSAELRQLGCAIPLPLDRLALPAAGQEIWSEAVRWLVEIMVSPQGANARQVMRDLLVRIGTDDFAQVRRAPPLLYHNDLSASVRRYYWSEDVGYALWLRLYEALGAETGNAQ